MLGMRTGCGYMAATALFISTGCSLETWQASDGTPTVAAPDTETFVTYRALSNVQSPLPGKSARTVLHEE